MQNALNICVGSTNPVKMEAARLALEKVYANTTFDIQTIAAPSGVPDQPFGDEETLQGAKNRAKYAFDEYSKQSDTPLHFSIGIEGGVQRLHDGQLECFAWLVAYNGSNFGVARTAAFMLPKAISDLVDGGMELGHANDAIFGVVNSKQAGGAVGHLTKGLISRAEYYLPAMILALMPFQWPDMYFGENTGK